MYYPDLEHRHSRLRPSPVQLIDTTLREGEQFVGSDFSTEDKVKIATALDEFGIDYLELSSPAASKRSLEDCRSIAAMGLDAKVLTHIRCHPRDAELALACGVDGINLVIGTSPQLRNHGHGMSLESVIERAVQVIEPLRSEGLELRFSTEDSMRTSRQDLWRVYEAVDALGVDRLGIADTVGIATPDEVGRLVSGLRLRTQAGIEFHGHNDTGCAVANSLAAIEAGARYINTTILGIGERNGITPLSGLIARLYTVEPNLLSRYRLELLPELDAMLAELLDLDIPFSAPITSHTAFAHKAGIHTSAILREPSAYEAMPPEVFGRGRYLDLGHRLTGWHAIQFRASQIGLELDEAAARRCTAEIKACSDRSEITEHQLDEILRRGARSPAETGLEGAPNG